MPSRSDDSSEALSDATDGGTVEARLEPGVALRFDRGPHLSNRAILYLHGLGSSQSGEKAEFFRTRFVGKDTPFCSIDFRGHGQSAETNLELSITRNLEDAARACDYLVAAGVEEIDVVGSSLGGLTALWLARQRPGNIRRVAVLAPAIGTRKKIEAILGDDLLGQWRLDGEMPYVNELGTTIVGYGFYEDLAEHADSDLAAGYDKPTLIIQGELDESVDADAVREFADTANGVKLHLWADAGHRLTERLDEVWELVADFLA